MRKMFYSANTGGFYEVAIHGENMPPDVVEITTDKYEYLLSGQETGKLIVPDSDGFPILAYPPKPSKKSIIISKILALESTVTHRRIREAVLNTEGAAWLADVDSQIAQLRTQL